jgi:ceramide synthetase
MTTTSLGHGVTPFRDFLYLLSEFSSSVVYGRRDSYTQSSPDLLPIPTGHDFMIFLYAALSMFLLTWVLRLTVFEPLARLLLPKPSTKKVQKFAQASNEMFLYSVFFLFGYRVYYQQAFIWPSSLWWQDFSSGSHGLMDPDYKFFYLLYAARYCAAFVSVMLEHKRADFVEMQIHHSVTVALVLLSYASGYNRVGGAVMFLLDCADPPLHIAKQFKYCAVDMKSWPQFMADRFFELFAVSFIASRDIVFPYIWWSAMFEGRDYFTHDLGTHACNALLTILLLLQVYWTSLIFIAVYNQILKGGIEDIRSDDESDEDNEDKGQAGADKPPIARKKNAAKKTTVPSHGRPKEESSRPDSPARNTRKSKKEN